MNTTVKRQYTAPEARRTRIRPLVVAGGRRRNEVTWKDRARAALAEPVQLERQFVTTQITLTEVADNEAQVTRVRVKKNWEWWQIVAPVAITACAITQLAMSIR